MPSVSILLPNLNSNRFIRDRIKSIQDQTHQDWELIIADSYSTDGSWEYLHDIAEQNHRVTAFQLPRGLYQAWNECIRKATGEYIYIATADDLMTPHCLEKMLHALSSHPDCDICDSALSLIDSEGKEIAVDSPLYRTHYEHCDFLRNKPHIRKMPHDFILQLSGKSLYTSITQLLIRKSLFEKTGYFPVDFSNIGDYRWALSAALHTNTFFIPEKLASWRLYAEQTTAQSNSRKQEKFQKLFDDVIPMIESLPENWQKTANSMTNILRYKILLLGIQEYRWNNFFHLILFPVFTLSFLWSFTRALLARKKDPLIHAYDMSIQKQAKKLNLNSLVFYLDSDS